MLKDQIFYSFNLNGFLYLAKVILKLLALMQFRDSDEYLCKQIIVQLSLPLVQFREWCRFSHSLVQKVAWELVPKICPGLLVVYKLNYVVYEGFPVTSSLTNQFYELFACQNQSSSSAER